MWLNLVCFNIAWFGLVLLGNVFVPIALIWLVLHIVYANQPKSEIILILVIASIGTLLDSTLTYLNIFIFQSAYYIPLWLTVLWLCFAATLSHSLRFLHNSRWLQLGAGALFAPLSYIAGSSFNAVIFSYSAFITYVILAIIWAPLMTLFFFIEQKINHQETAHA